MPRSIRLSTCEGLSSSPPIPTSTPGTTIIPSSPSGRSTVWTRLPVGRAVLLPLEALAIPGPGDGVAVGIGERDAGCAGIRRRQLGAGLERRCRSRWTLAKLRLELLGVDVEIEGRHATGNAHRG